MSILAWIPVLYSVLVLLWLVVLAAGSDQPGAYTLPITFSACLVFMVTVLVLDKAKRRRDEAQDVSDS